MAGVLSKYGIAVPFYFAAGLSLANAVAVYFFLPESLRPELRSRAAHEKGRLAAAFETLAHPQFRTVAGVYFLLITAFSIMTTAYVLFTAHVFGYSGTERLSVRIRRVDLGRDAGRGIWHCGPYVRRIEAGDHRLPGADDRPFATPYSSPAFGGLAGLLSITALMAIGNAFATPGLTSLGSKIAAAHEQGRAMGVMQSGASLARAIGPTICGFLLNNQANAMDRSTIFVPTGRPPGSCW